jgi:hypothetical protein
LLSIWLYGTELAAGKLQCRDIDGWAYSVGAELAEQQAATSHRAVFILCSLWRRRAARLKESMASDAGLESL